VGLRFEARPSRGRPLLGPRRPACGNRGAMIRLKGTEGGSAGKIAVTALSEPRLLSKRRNWSDGDLAVAFPRARSPALHYRRAVGCELASQQRSAASALPTRMCRRRTSPGCPCTCRCCSRRIGDPGGYNHCRTRFGCFLRATTSTRPQSAPARSSHFPGS
jgi:hypothetical protein